MIYLDGSALCRFLPGVRHYEAFGAWAQDHIDELVTTQLGFTELRQAAELYPRSSAERVGGIVDVVRAGVAVIRFSDDNVAISSHATAVLKPFAALHVGAAVAHPTVDTIVTYDPALANVARIYDLAVVSPGLPEGWYLEYQGPPEHWKPVALDAPYDPGPEFDAPAVARRPDIYEVALEAARRAAAAAAGSEHDDAEGESATAVEPEGADEGESVTAVKDDGADEGESATAIDGPNESESVTAVEVDGEADVDGGSLGEGVGEVGVEGGAEGGAAAASEEISELDRALRDAEAAAAARGETGEGELDDADEEDEGALAGDVPSAPGRRALEPDEQSGPAPIACPGTYRPRVEAWHEGDPEEDQPNLRLEGDAEKGDGGASATSEGETGAGETGASETGASATSEGETRATSEGGGGVPWHRRPEPTTVASGGEPLLPTPLPPPPLPPPPLPPPPLALAPPAPIEPVGIPNLPREERGVPPVMPPTRDSIGSAVRRPMFDTDPHPDSRASRPPSPVPPVPPEESSPLTVPIMWNVELDEPEAYLPLRFDSESARTLSSATVSFAGGQGGLTLESAGSVAVPALEPTSRQSGSTIGSDSLSPMAQTGSLAPVSARERKAADKAAKKEDELRAKAAKKMKGTASPPPPSTPTPPLTTSLPSSPTLPPTASSEAWKLEDVLNFGPKKRGS